MYWKSILSIFLIAFLVSCSKKSEVTGTKAGLFSDIELKNKIEDVKQGTIIDAVDYKNHNWNRKTAIKVRVNGKEGYMDPGQVVVGQDPENSVFKWGYRSDYKRFYDTKDKSHYKYGTDFPQLTTLPKDKIPLDELLKNSNLE